MAILRDPVTYDNTGNYIATLALFCGISCTILMLRFRGFRATFNLSSGKRAQSEYYEDIPVLSATEGAYRSNREEFYGNGSLSDPPKRIDPSMVKLPPSSGPAVKPLKPGPSAKPDNPGSTSQPQNPKPITKQENIQPTAKPQRPAPTPELHNPGPTAKSQSTGPIVKPSKSTNDLTQQTSRPQNKNLNKSTPDVSSNPQGENSNRDSINLKNTSKEAKNQEKELKKLEKKRLADEKKREKLAKQERVKQERELRAREKQEAQFRAKQDKLAKAKVKTPVAPTRVNPLAQGPPLGPPVYSTNTLESSISRTSGPPAYSEATNSNVVQNEGDNTGNTSFGKPVDNTSSWDLISKHRQEISRPPVAGGSVMKQTVLDLEYTNATGRKSIYL